MLNAKSLYVVVDSQYPLEYRAAQAVHAAVAYMLKYPNSVWKNERLVLLKAPDILKWKERLECLGKDHAYFVEPDVGNKVTAIATVDTGRMFRDLELN